MVRKFVFAFVVMAFSVGILSAAEMFGLVTKVDGNKITFTEFKKGEKGKKGAKGETKTLTVAKDAKIQEMKGFGPDAEFTALKDGLKNKLLTELPEKGWFARVVTNDKNEVTELSVSAFKGFGKKKKDGGQ